MCACLFEAMHSSAEINSVRIVTNLPACILPARVCIWITSRIDRCVKFYILHSHNSLVTVLLQMLVSLSFGSCVKHSYAFRVFFFPSSPVFSYVIYYCMELFYVNSAYLLVMSHSFSRLDANAKDRSLEKEQVC